MTLQRDLQGKNLWSDLIRRVAFSALGSALLVAKLVCAEPYPELDNARIGAIARMLPAEPAGFGVPCSNRAAWEPRRGEARGKR